MSATERANTTAVAAGGADGDEMGDILLVDAEEYEETNRYDAPSPAIREPRHAVATTATTSGKQKSAASDKGDNRPRVPLPVTSQAVQHKMNGGPLSSLSFNVAYG